MHMVRFTGTRSAGLGLALLFGAASAAEAQQATLSGRVTEQEGGNAIEAAQVMIVGTRLGQLTSADGRFIFRNLGPGTVQVRVLRVPYQAQIRSITLVQGQEATLDFALERAVAQLEQVVTTATGEQRRLEVGNAIAQVNADSLVQNLPIANMTDLLSARTPGVQVAGGNLTGTGARVRIRGTNSLSLNNDPIYIIDGIRMESASGSSSIGVGGAIPSRVSDINPEEIASIEVVRGPSAATLYGTDAANGVIVIRTKRGQVGRPQWNAYTEQGAVTDRNEYPTAYTGFGVLTSNGRATQQCFLVSVAAGTCTRDSVAAFNLFEDDETTPLATAHRQQYGLQVSGGSEQVQYFVSGEWEDETGVSKIPDFDVARLNREGTEIRDEWMRPNARTRASGRANMTLQLSPEADVVVSTNYIQSRQRLPQTDNNTTGLLSSAYGGPGTKFNTNSAGDTLYGYRAFTPGDIFQETVTQDINRLIGSVGTNWRPLGWLTARSNVGLDFTNRVDSDLCRFDNCSDFGDNRLGFKADNRTTFLDYTLDGSATGTFRLRPSIQSRTTVGVQFVREVFDRNGAFGEVLPPGATQVSAAASQFASEVTEETRTLGAFIEQGFDFNDRLFTTIALRADDNSAFGKDFSAVYYPKASVSWVISDEPFFPQPGWLDQLRLRSAIGASGVQPGTTDALQFFEPRTALTEDGEIPGILFSALGNPGLKPERTQEIEVGFDGTFLANRLNFEVTYYNKSSRDALVERILPGSLGTDEDERFENLGEVTNTGMEALVSAQLVARAGFGWDLTLSGSTNRNELVDLGDVPPIIGTTIRQIEGYPLNGYWQQPILGFRDADGNQIITASEVEVGDEAVFLGYSVPRHEVVLTNGFNFLDGLVRVTALVDYKGGHKRLNGTDRIRCQSRNNCRGLVDPTASLEDQARVVALRFHSARTQAGFIEDADFIRFRELAVSLTAPGHWASRINARSVTATFAARNLGTITDYSGIDPESDADTDVDIPSDFQTAPPPSLFTFRLNVGF